MVLGSHHQSSSLLVQQEGVVGRAVRQTLKRHKVVGLQHFCGAEGEEGFIRLVKMSSCLLRSCRKETQHFLDVSRVSEKYIRYSITAIVLLSNLQGYWITVLWIHLD